MMMETKVIANHKNLFNKILKNKKKYNTEIDGFEIEVFLTKDKYCVIDQKKEVDIAEINQNNLQDLYNMQDNSIYLLDDVLDIAEDYNEVLIKVNNDPEYPFLEKNIIDIVKEKELQNKAVLTSFKKHILEKFNDLTDEIKIALGFNAGLYKPWKKATKLGAEAIYTYYGGVVPSVVDKCKKTGLDLYIYGANVNQVIKKFMKFGVKGIITGNLETAISIKNKIKGEKR